MYKNAVKKYDGLCVMIVRLEKDNTTTFLGTGFVCHKKGYILTCAHIINLTDKLAIVTSQPLNDFNHIDRGKISALHVSVSQYDAINDVALLKLPVSVELNLPTCLFGNEKFILVGSSAFYLGYPFGDMGLHSIKLSGCTISSKVISKQGTKQFQIDTMVHEGNSGGPLIDLRSGTIIGIISGRFSPVGVSGSMKVGNRSVGTDSSVTFATTINYGIELLKSEGLKI